jgi:hypothetical protein
MNDTSTMMIQRDGKWIWLDNGEEVKNPPGGSSQESKPQTSKELGSLDSDQIPIRVRFDPMTGRYFERLMNVAVPGTDFLSYQKELEKSLGQHYFSMWQRDTEVAKWRELASKRYESIIAMDNTDSDAYYNLAVIDYNRAVFMYRKLGPDTDMFDAITLQEEASALIRTRALVNMEKAYALAPEKGEVVRGIMMMHRALDHEKDVAYFKAEIERLISEGKIKADQHK